MFSVLPKLFLKYCLNTFTENILNAETILKRTNHLNSLMSSILYDYTSTPNLKDNMNFQLYFMYELLLLLISGLCKTINKISNVLIMYSYFRYYRISISVQRENCIT